MDGLFGVASGTDSRLTPTQKRAMFQKAYAELPPDKLMQQIGQAALQPIARQMIETAVFRKMVQVDTIDLPIAMYQIKRRQIALVVAKYGAPPVRWVQYPRLTITPFYIQTMPEVELSDLMDAMFDAASDILDDAGREMGVKEDAIFVSLLNRACPAGTTTSSTVAPTISAGPAGVGFKLNVSTYRKGTGDTAPDGGVAGDPTPRDFVMAMTYPQQLGYNPDTIFTNPYALGIMSGQTAFSSFMQWGTREVSENGLIQNAYGKNIVWSPLAPLKSFFFIDRQESLRLVEREGITVKPEVHGLRQQWLVYERVAPFVRNANAIFRLDFFS